MPTPLTLAGCSIRNSLWLTLDAGKFESIEVNPVTGVAYKLGQLEILKLREEARQKLGDKFDLRAFHDEVLGNGALPLDVLDSEVSGWIDRQAKK